MNWLCSIKKGLARSLFTLQLARQHLSSLRAFLDPASPHTCPQFLQMDLQALSNKGIRVLILDFDGVLAPHAEVRPLPEVNKQLQEAQALFQVFILSNRPCPKRIALLKAAYPKIQSVVVNEKKPYPAGFQYVKKHSHCSPNQILMVDDRLLTGVLMAVSQSAPACWINQPYQDFRKRPFQEAFFAGLRWLDKILIKSLS